MKSLFDSSVLVPALVDQLANHQRSFTALSGFSSGDNDAFCSTHALAECYSVMTALPLKRRIRPADAERLIGELVATRLTVIALGPDDYRHALVRVAGLSLGSGVVYDALHVQAAERADCTRIFTFNVKHFQTIAGARMVVTAP